ncbi:MAG: Zn-dependent exopeptidase M28, partial [Proteobacteria bacterium]
MLLPVLILSLSLRLSAQVLVPSYNAVAQQCSESNILASLNEFQAFGVKYRGTIAQANTLNWLKQKYLSYGYTVSEIVEDPFTYNNSTCKNLIVTKIGTTYPDTFVIIDGHYDTLNGPGTNDNGSGTAVILETARLLASIPTEYSIKFIHFAGEEDGLIGSQHYVDNVVNATSPKMDIRLLINLDQVGGVAGEINNTITCERDQSNNPSTNNAASAVMTTQLANCMELYSTLETTISFAYASDYVPFEDNGEIITGLFETNESPFPHTPNDLLENMDPTFVYNVAQGMIGAALHFSVACTSCNLDTDGFTASSVSVYPNPAVGHIMIDKGDLSSYSFSLTNAIGQVVLFGERENPHQQERIALDGVGHGIY